MIRFVKMICSDESEALQARHPNAFLLLAQIARRAKWKDCPITKLRAGQAFIGDFREAGLTSEMAYRHAKKILAETGLATFQGTNRGTTATISSSMIFAISPDSCNDQENAPTIIPATDKERSSNGQGTTNKTERKKTERRKEGTMPPIPAELSSDAFAEAWEKWITHRKEKKAPLTPTSASQQLKSLALMGEERAIEAVLYSTEKGWTGIYPPKSDEQPAGRPSSPAPPPLDPVKNGRVY
jgi:hypothetical protein